MSNYTKGEWKVRQVTGLGFKGQIGYAIDYNEDQEQIVDYVYEEADARLIAAAPELLEALHGLVRAYEALPGSVTHSGSRHSHALYAIRKALGEEK